MAVTKLVDITNYFPSVGACTDVSRLAVLLDACESDGKGWHCWGDLGLLQNALANMTGYVMVCFKPKVVDTCNISTLHVFISIKFMKTSIGKKNKQTRKSQI